MAQVLGWVWRSVRAAAADDDGRGGGGAMAGWAEVGGGEGGGGGVVYVCNLDLMFPRGCPEFGLRSLVVLDQ